MPDHVHMMISIPPKYAVSQVIGFIKGKSAIHLARVYGERKRNFVGQHFWARGYWVCSSGNVTDDVWKEYIQSQKPPEPDDDFRVVWHSRPLRPADPAFSRNPKPPALAGGVFTVSTTLRFGFIRG